jgi:glycine/D-amino acid oxidase-like deaminating enzyme
MRTYDWIVVGAGMTGAALSYELAKQGFSVLLIEQHAKLQGATRFGYGGIAYWSGTTELTCQLCAEGIARHRNLSEELDSDTEFRELDLLLTIAPDQDPHTIAACYQHFAIPPQLLSVQAACEMEPLLAPAAIAGALTVKHGHVEPEKMTQAYVQAFLRWGGNVHFGRATDLLRQAEKVLGVICGETVYASGNVAICAGAWTRSLLKAVGIPVPIYFTQAEIVETPPVDLRLQTLVMPAEISRLQLETAATAAELDPLWDQPGHEPAAAILDAGVVQLLDGRMRMGQLSRTVTELNPVIDASASEVSIRNAIGAILPSLKDLPGTWHQCQIAFSRDSLPLIGAIPSISGVHLFSGFSNPLAIVPALACRFATYATGKADELITQLSPARF